MSQQLPKLVKDKIDDYNYAAYKEKVNKELEEMHEEAMNIYQMMRENYQFIAKCNGFDIINGIKKYCTSFTYRVGSQVTQTECVYICENCGRARSSYCDKHASGNLYIVHEDVAICKKCINNEGIDWKDIEEWDP